MVKALAFQLAWEVGFESVSHYDKNPLPHPQCNLTRSYSYLLFLPNLAPTLLVYPAGFLMLFGMMKRSSQFEDPQ